MCGRFSLSNPKNIEKAYKIKNKLPLFQPSWNITPSQTIPTIIRNSPNKIRMMKWGFLFSKKANSGTINIRSETTREKPYFRHFLQNRRCIIPADGFYEWGMVNLEGKEEKYPFYFFRDKGKFFSLAGLYNEFPDAEGKSYYSCAIVTCPANQIMKKVHSRMPAIISEEDEDIWLDPENNDFDKLYNLLVPYSKKDMRVRLVSKRVNNPKNDDSDLIKPLKTYQTGF